MPRIEIVNPEDGRPEVVNLTRAEEPGERQEMNHRGTEGAEGRGMPEWTEEDEARLELQEIIQAARDRANGHYAQAGNNLVAVVTALMIYAGGVALVINTRWEGEWKIVTIAAMAVGLGLALADQRRAEGKVRAYTIDEWREARRTRNAASKAGDLELTVRTANRMRNIEHRIEDEVTR